MDQSVSVNQTRNIVTSSESGSVKKPHVCIITDRVRSTRGGNVFTLFTICGGGGGYLLSGPDGGGGGGTYSQVRMVRGGVPTFPGLGGGGYPLSGLDGGGGSTYLPRSGCGGGVPTLRSGWGGTYPGGGYLPMVGTPPPPHQGRYPLPPG